MKNNKIEKYKTKVSKLLIFLYLTIMTILLGNNKVYAGITLPSDLRIDPTLDPVASSMGGQIIWIAQVILYAAAVIIVIFAGVKYIGAAPDAKAEFKKKLIYMVTGAIILFAAGSIVRIIGGMAMNNI